MANAFPAWNNPDDPSDARWDTVLLGDVFLPGVSSIENLEVGRDIDVQKRRKKEKARIRDNGLSPVAFDIVCEITHREWPMFVAIYPKLEPRREGAVRTPMQIVHPLVNLMGVKDIYIHKISIPKPSARNGMKITIRCAEWFEEEKDSNGAGSGANSKKVRLAKPNYFGDPKKLAARLQAADQVLPPTDSATVLERLIGAAENTPNPLFEE